MSHLDFNCLILLQKVQSYLRIHIKLLILLQMLKARKRRRLYNNYLKELSKRKNKPGFHNL
jgi:hypothetical protein